MLIKRRTNDRFTFVLGLGLKAGIKVRVVKMH